MTAWQWIWNSGLGLFVLAMICMTGVNLMLIKAPFFLTKQKEPFAALLLPALLVSMLQLIPMYVAQTACATGSINEIVHSLAFFPFPIVLIVYEWMYRKLFKAPVGMVRMALEWLLMGQYLLLLMYTIFYIFYVRIFSGNFFIQQSLSLISMLLSMLLSSWLVRKLIITPNCCFLILPYGYVPENMVRGRINMFVSSLSIYALLVSVRVIFSHMTQPESEFSLLTICAYLALLCVLGFSMVDKYDKNRRTVISWQTEQTDKYLQSLLQATSDFHSIKHDFYNILQTYGGYIEVGNLEGLSNYHKSLTDSTVEAGRNLDIIESLRKRPPLYTLLNIKKNQAVQQDVCLDIFNVGPLVRVIMNDFDLCRILSNLLDNAIHAAAKTDEKLVSLRSESYPNEIKIWLINSVIEYVDVDVMIQASYTTKAGHSGQGLTSVLSILNHHRSCALQLQCDSSYLTALLTLEAT